MWHPLDAVDHFPPAAGREFTVGERVLAVFRQGDQFQVLDGICPHAGGPLAEGTLNGNVVTCPWHGWQFDVTTGRHCLTPRIAQNCYAVRVNDGVLEVELP